MRALYLHIPIPSLVFLGSLHQSFCYKMKHYYFFPQLQYSLEWVHVFIKNLYNIIKKETSKQSNPIVLMLLTFLIRES